MFEIDGVYANRKGNYTVLEIESPKMQVRYEDGTYAQLNMNIQGRIWQNIMAEREAEDARVSRKAANKSSQTAATRHFIKSINLPVVEELMFPGWQERVVLSNNPIQATRIKPGDRLIFYAIEINTFFAVATITSVAFKANPKDYFYPITEQEAFFFSVDIDVTSFQSDQSVARDSVELEDYPDFQKLLAQPENFFSISEDDFELLAELLTELQEVESNGLDDEDFEEEDEE